MSWTQSGTELVSQLIPEEDIDVTKINAKYSQIEITVVVLVAKNQTGQPKNEFLGGGGHVLLEECNGVGPGSNIPLHRKKPRLPKGWQEHTMLLSPGGEGRKNDIARRRLYLNLREIPVTTINRRYTDIAVNHYVVHQGIKEQLWKICGRIDNNKAPGLMESLTILWIWGIN